MAQESVNELKTLTLEGFGKMPAMEFRLQEDGRILWRYMVEKGDYPGFDGLCYRQHNPSYVAK